MRRGPVPGLAADSFSKRATWVQRLGHTRIQHVPGLHGDCYRPSGHTDPDHARTKAATIRPASPCQHAALKLPSPPSSTGKPACSPHQSPISVT